MSNTVDAEANPIARKDELEVRELAEEVIIYDLRTHKAHCLNRSAALVWKNCDGEHTVADVARAVGSEFGTRADETVVWSALAQLEKFDLLDKRPARPAGVPRLSRRAMIRRVGVAVAVPLVVSILAPTAQAQMSCDPNAFPDPCPAGFSCNGGFCEPDPP